MKLSPSGTPNKQANIEDNTGDSSMLNRVCTHTHIYIERAEPTPGKSGVVMSPCALCDITKGPFPPRYPFPEKGWCQTCHLDSR